MKTDYDKVKEILKKYNIKDIEEIEYGKDCFDELLDLILYFFNISFTLS